MGLRNSGENRKVLIMMKLPMTDITEQVRSVTTMTDIWASLRGIVIAEGRQ